MILRTYKGAVTRAARKAGLAFGWQPRYHDHVVRNWKSPKHIRAYVESNPLHWAEDVLHPDRILP